MQGILVDIADHPTQGNLNGHYKRRVHIKKHVTDWENEVISCDTECIYYENVAGQYGDPVSEPQPIRWNRSLAARTSGGPVVFVQNTTGAELVRKYRDVEEPIPAEEQVEGGPAVKIVSQEYWVLKSDDVTEVPVANVITMFAFLENIARNVSVVTGDMLRQFVLNEVANGTYDVVGR